MIMWDEVPMVADRIFTLLLHIVTWLSVVATVLPAATVTASAPSGDGLTTEVHDEAGVTAGVSIRFDLSLNPALLQDQTPLDNADLEKQVADAGLTSDVSFLPNDALYKNVSLFETEVDGKVRTISDPEARVRKVRRNAVATHLIGSEADRCQRHNLYVNFTTIELDGVFIFPDGYNAYYCAGKCENPMSDNRMTSTHAWIQSIIHSKFPSLAPNPCCIPTVLSDISAIIWDINNQPAYKRFKNMVVQECGCR